MTIRAIEVFKDDDGEFKIKHRESFSERTFMFVPKNEYQILCIYNDKFIAVDDLQAMLEKIQIEQNDITYSKENVIQEKTVF